MFTLASMLNLLRLLVKWVSTYLSGAKNDPWVLAHRAHSSCALSRALQFSSVVLLKVTMFVSSTKPRVEVAPPPTMVRSSAAKYRKRIGDRDDPWGIPFVVGMASLVYPGRAR